MEEFDERLTLGFVERDLLVFRNYFTSLYRITINESIRTYGRHITVEFIGDVQFDIGAVGGNDINNSIGVFFEDVPRLVRLHVRNWLVDIRWRVHR